VEIIINSEKRQLLHDYYQ